MESWFFGQSGFTKLKELNDTFKEKAVNFANAQLGADYISYSPWMCNIENLNKLQHLFSDKKFILFDGPDNKTLEKEYLQSDLEKKLTFGNLLTQEKMIMENSINAFSKMNVDLAKLFHEVIKVIIPMNTEADDFQKIGNGFSTHHAKGAIFISVPKLEVKSKEQLMINIAHELGHQSLFIYQSADPIIKEGLESLVYSYVRKAERPAIQTFHATVALSFMVRFLTQIKNPSTFYIQSLQKLKVDFLKSLDSFDDVVFTEIGNLLFEDLKKYASSLN